MSSNVLFASRPNTPTITQQAFSNLYQFLEEDGPVYGLYRRAAQITRLQCHIGGNGQINQVCTLCRRETSYTAADIAQLFMDNIVGLLGLPQTIVSDRDTIFVSAFWREMSNLPGAQHTIPKQIVKLKGSTNALKCI